MKAIKIDDTGSVLVDTGIISSVTNELLCVWVDVWHDGSELVADWNKYIFQLDCALDVEIKDFQVDCDNFSACTAVAIDAYMEQFCGITLADCQG